jgi:hypothetical protein
MQYGGQLNSRALSGSLRLFGALRVSQSVTGAAMLSALFLVGGTMAKIVNLNKFRKQKAKDARVKQAETNRRVHGRTKAERARDALQKKKLETAVDHARLGSTPDIDDESAP